MHRVALIALMFLTLVPARKTVSSCGFEDHTQGDAQYSLCRLLDNLAISLFDQVSPCGHDDQVNMTLGTAARVAMPSSGLAPPLGFFLSHSRLPPASRLYKEYPSDFGPAASRLFRCVSNAIASREVDLAQKATTGVKKTSGPEAIECLPVNFQELGISSVIANQLLKEFKIVIPTRIQVATIPEILRKSWNPENLTVHDLLVEGKTGGGKTLAFALPILSTVDNYSPQLQAILCAPTRELALQTARIVQALCKGGKKSRKLNPVKVMAMEGTGDGKYRDRKDLFEFQQNPPHILIATPGTAAYILENQRTVSLKGLKALVLDEVDQALSMEINRKGIKYLLGALDSNVQKILVSATLTDDVERVSRQYLNAPKKIFPVITVAQANSLTQTADEESKMPPRLEHCLHVLRVPTLEFKMQKLVQLQRGLRWGRLQGIRRGVRSSDISSMLVFINDAPRMTEYVEILRSNYSLRTRGLGAQSTKGYYNQVRNEVAEGKIDIILATDIVARGMDLYGVTDVVNFDIPRSANMYLHRAGRAGRTKGKFSSDSHVVTFIDQEDEKELRKDVRSLGAKPKRIYIREQGLEYGT